MKWAGSRRVATQVPGWQGGKAPQPISRAAHADSPAALKPRLCSPAPRCAGRLGEAERKLRALDEYAHASNATAQVASLATRLGSLEDSVGHLAQAGACPLLFLLHLVPLWTG